MNSVDIVDRFWKTVWQHPYDIEAIDDFVVEDFRLTAGGEEIVSREAFKAWINQFRSKILDLHLEPIESFQNEDGTRVASRWVVTGRNNGIMGTEPDPRADPADRHGGVGRARRWQAPAELGRAQLLGGVPEPDCKGSLSGRPRPAVPPQRSRRGNRLRQRRTPGR